MRAGDPVAEWKACDLLRQSDLNGLTAAGIHVLSLAGDAYGGGYCVARDKIVPHRVACRFEFSRHDETAGEATAALIVLALDVYGDTADLVAFHGGPTPFVGSWLGRVGMLGEDSLWRARDALTVHAGPLDWFRAERRGVCIVDPVRAAPVLRDAGTLEVGSQVERRRLADMLTVRLPDIRIRPAVRSAAA